MHDFWSSWRTDAFICKCGWKGTGSKLVPESFAGLFEVHCPNCDHKFGRISYPDKAETEEAASQGNSEAIAALPRFDNFVKIQGELAESREKIANLPDLQGDELIFTFAVEAGSSLCPDFLLIRHQGEEIYREGSGFEWWSSLVELSRLLIHRYSNRIAWIDPTDDASELLGDDLRAAGEIRRFLKENRVSPPTGRYAARD